MKPERIYSTTIEGTYTVPIDKAWKVLVAGEEVRFILNEKQLNFRSEYGGYGNAFWAMPGNLLTVNSLHDAIIIIYEYSISGSGTSQGMDYIEP